MLQLTERDRHIIESHEQYCFTITGLYHLLSNSDLHQPFSEVKIPCTSYRNLPQSCCRKMDLTQIKKIINLSRSWGLKELCSLSIWKWRYPQAENSKICVRVQFFCTKFLYLYSYIIHIYVELLALSFFFHYTSQISFLFFCETGQL